DRPLGEARALAWTGDDAAQRGEAEALRARLDRLEAALAQQGAQRAAERKELLGTLRAPARGAAGLRLAGTALAADRGGGLEDRALAREQGRAFEAALGPKAAEIAHALAALGERFSVLDALAAGKDGEGASDLAKAVCETVCGALTRRFEALEQRLEQLGGEVERLARPDALDASLDAQLAGAEHAKEAHERDLMEIHEGLIKVGPNQQTLGNNLDTGRLENGGDLGIISTRLEQLERTSIELLTRVDTEVRALTHRLGDSDARPAARLQRWLIGAGARKTLGRDGQSRALP